jgi:hypothetical protein
MLAQGKGYISNVLIDMPTTESNRLKSEMHDKTAALFAPALYDALVSAIQADRNGIYTGRTVKVNDLNFALWALIPYLTARSGKPSSAIPFEEAATIRPDGGVNICYCSIKNPDALPVKHSGQLTGGPSWNGDDSFLLWLIDTVWGGCRVGNYHPDIMNQDLASLKAMFEGGLSTDEAIRMAERGFISRQNNPDGTTIDTLNIVWLTREANNRLLSLANGIRDALQKNFDELKSAYTAAFLSDTPEHLKKAKAYGLQHIFHSDGYFLIFMLNKLVEHGKLKLPTEEHRNSLGAVVVAN